MTGNVDEAPESDPAMFMESRAAEISEHAHRIRTMIIRTFAADGLITDAELLIIQELTAHAAALDEKADDELLAIALMRRGRHSGRVHRLAAQILPADDCA